MYSSSKGMTERQRQCRETRTPTAGGEEELENKEERHEGGKEQLCGNAKV